jgi:hypothetical protein
MTPKLKAEELVYKMHNVDFHDLPDDLAMQYVHAKQCALIAVDEILNVCKTYLSSYYLEVKKEIEKL